MCSSTCKKSSLRDNINQERRSRTLHIILFSAKISGNKKLLMLYSLQPIKQPILIFNCKHVQAYDIGILISNALSVVSSLVLYCVI